MTSINIEEVEDFLDYYRRPSTTGDKILEFLQEHGQLKPKQIYILFLGRVSRVTIHRQLNRLVTKGLINKEGKAPHVFYWMEKLEEPV
jgi:predicted HTH transcriptional regulator